ncbi:MAG: YidB family protein [Pseudolabrys sp.]
MGTLDDVLGSAVPQGSVAKPLIIALGALLASGALFKNANSGAASPSSPAPSPPSPDLQAGLGGLLNQFQQNGLGDVMKSWISPGQNQPVSPNQLSSALGPQIIQILAQKTGLSEQEITSHLSQILPNVVDQLTPNGRLPAQ